MAAVILLVALGVGIVVALPIPRAWLLVLCGNYAAATEIYENRLARQPNRLPLYLTLANLYLLAGRQDERALIAYRVVLQMRLATQHLQALKRFDSTPRRRALEKMASVRSFLKRHFRKTGNQQVSAIAGI